MIHSVLEERCEVKSEDPLEVIAGSWLRGKTHQVPEVVWQAVGKLV